VSSITIVSDTPNCGVTYDCHYDDRNSFIIQAIVHGSVFLILMATVLNFSGVTALRATEAPAQTGNGKVAVGIVGDLHRVDPEPGREHGGT
jgi:hypothetical protein